MPAFCFSILCMVPQYTYHIPCGPVNVGHFSAFFFFFKVIASLEKHRSRFPVDCPLFLPVLITRIEDYECLEKGTRGRKCHRPRSGPSMYTLSGGYIFFLSPLRIKVGPVEVGLRIMRKHRLFSVLHPHHECVHVLSCSTVDLVFILVWLQLLHRVCRGCHTVFAFVSYEWCWTLWGVLTGHVQTFLGDAFIRTPWLLKNWVVISCVNSLKHSGHKHLIS